MAKHLRVSIIILWLALALSALSICRAAVGDIATQAFFSSILSETPGSCAGKTFYKYSDFIDAASAFPRFGTTGPSDDNKREIAAFFANVAHETDNLCYVEEKEKSVHCDDPSNTQYPCAPGQQYYGRGPLQLTGNVNYGEAGKYLEVNLLNNPGILAQDGLTSWKSALWFWNVNSNCHTAITSNQGFGATIQAINGAQECKGKATDKVNDRINHYTDYCSQFGVNPGNNLQC